MSFNLKNIGLTSRILLSIWLTLILIVTSIVVVLKLNTPDRHNLPMPPIQLHDDLLLKLLNEPYSSVKQWFRQQPKKDTRRLFIVKNDQDILNRRIPDALDALRTRLSEQKPFIHERRHGRAMLGRLFLLPNGNHIEVLVHTRIGPPPFHHTILENIAYLITLLIAISGIISWLLTRYILKPIIELRHATHQIVLGNFDLRLSSKIKQSGDIALLAQDFDHMADTLQRSLQSHKHLLHDISHELRSPITRLQLATELAKQAFSDKDNEHFLRIDKEIEQIKDMITTLLNLPAYELEPHLAIQDSIDLLELIETIRSDLNFQQDHIKIEINNQLPMMYQHECIIHANSQLLHSAIENVLRNALNYHDTNSAITINIQLLTKNASHYLAIRICDQGPGVRSELLEEIFKPFYRTSAARDRLSGGHGLGLAISKRALELHGGYIEACNQKPSGLCVTLSLPLSLTVDVNPI
ncbi:HAMP domain-containing protein [Bermanella marisrubri]|uniref:histidine kinase n=1 Tax=Bermanella marisrubri TaxID=207949 RepID=Q1N330_9GAMM|nr:ATP-binding protein [Bermanella marisrubri]EAT12761.1 Signal transduction histidine kinase [Oceanobacter sp. RED65] [Bermanella marisrubri]QIZ85123.1 HAMP domain-containing protein [Bermanella marisrubri]